MVFQFSNSHRSIFDPGQPMCLNHSTLWEEFKLMLNLFIKILSLIFNFKLQLDWGNNFSSHDLLDEEAQK